MYYYLLPQKGLSWLIFPDESEALGGMTAPLQAALDELKRQRRWASPVAVWHKGTLPPILFRSKYTEILYQVYTVSWMKLYLEWNCILNETVSWMKLYLEWNCISWMKLYILNETVYLEWNYISWMELYLEWNCILNETVSWMKLYLEWNCILIETPYF